MPLSTHMAFTVAFMTGIVPAITLLYFTLKDYEKHINDKFMFFSILTALFLGTLVAFFHLIMSGYEGLFSSLIVLILILVSFAIFEALVKVVFVQLKRFEAKFDTTFYGATFGVIIGASITMGRTYAFFVTDLTIYEMVGIFIFALAMIFMNCATGAWLGYGVYQHDLKWSFINVILISIPFNFVIFLWYSISSYEPTIEDVIVISIGMVYGLIVFLYAYFKILPEALPEKFHRERLRDSRKEYMAKKKGKGES